MVTPIPDSQLINRGSRRRDYRILVRKRGPTITGRFIAHVARGEVRPGRRRRRAWLEVHPARRPHSPSPSRAVVFRRTRVTANKEVQRRGRKLSVRELNRRPIHRIDSRKARRTTGLYRGFVGRYDGSFAPLATTGYRGTQAFCPGGRWPERSGPRPPGDHPRGSSAPPPAGSTGGD